MATVVGKFFKWVSKTVTTVKELFSSGKIQKELDKVVGIVNTIKQYADSPIAVIVVKATPFTWDDNARVFISELLQKVLDKYKTLKSAAALQEIAGKLAQKETGLPLDIAKEKVEEAYQSSKLGV